MKTSSAVCKPVFYALYQVYNRETLYIEPENPWGNGYNESFNG